MAFPSAWALVLLIRGEAGWGKRIQRINSHNVNTRAPTFLAHLISPHRPSSLTNEPKYHLLIRTLCDAARDLDPELKFTSIQVNKDSKYGLHCDSSNLGLSGFLGLGNFTGGWSYLGCSFAIPHEYDSYAHEHANGQASCGCTTQPASVMSVGAAADFGTSRTSFSVSTATSPTSPASSLASGKLVCVYLLSVSMGFRWQQAVHAL